MTKSKKKTAAKDAANNENSHGLNRETKTLRLEATEIEAMYYLENTSSVPRVVKKIMGKAYIENDLSIAVHGDKETESRILSLSIRGVDFDEKSKEELQKRFKEDKLFVLEPIFSYVDLGFFKGDWEIPLEDTWYVEIALPTKTFEDFFQVVKEMRDPVLSLGLKLKEIYSDGAQFAPISFPVNWLLLESEHGGSGHTEGQVSNFSFRERRSVRNNAENITEEHKEASFDEEGTIKSFGKKLKKDFFG